MRLLVDAGNTRLKWQLRDQYAVVASGASLCDDFRWLDGLTPYASKLGRIAVSTVISESKRQELVARLSAVSGADVHFYWPERSRGGLTNAYSDVSKMGADRWHAMYAGWQQGAGGFAVVDAGSAVTVDYVADDGRHIGGYILPRKQMMLRSLRLDAARIGFESVDASAGGPGRSTTECVQQGILWLWQGMARHLADDCRQQGLSRVLCTGGDASALLAAGLSGEYHPDLVLAGLASIDSESAGS